MANVNQTLASNFVATPPVQSPSRQLHGSMRIACGTVALVAGDLSAGDTIMLAPIPTNAAVVSIKIFNDDLDSGSTVTMHVGLYTADGDVTAKDVDAYASATTDLRAAVLTGTEVAFEARNISTMGQRVWEDAGDSVDPGGYYLIGLETDAAGDTAGDVSYLITYVVD
jgi:sulfate adenylyltransferase subunit 1 (EFTu-like GTPase family)